MFILVAVLDPLVSCMKAWWFYFNPVALAVICIRVVHYHPIFLLQFAVCSCRRCSLHPSLS